MEFFIGEKVGFVHETGFGIIKKEVSISKYLVENEFGIELTVLKANLVKIYSENYKGRIVVKDFENSEKLTKAKAKQRDILEIDLHLEEFQVAQKNLTNAEILLFGIVYPQVCVPTMVPSVSEVGSTAYFTRSRLLLSVHMNV
jgi:hypothetical protein